MEQVTEQRQMLSRTRGNYNRPAAVARVGPNETVAQIQRMYTGHRNIKRLLVPVRRVKIGVRVM